MGLLIAPELPSNRLQRRFMGSQLEVTLGETLGAVFRDPVLRPTELFQQRAEIEGAAPRPEPEVDEDREFLVGPGGVATTDRFIEERAEPTDLEAPESLNEEFGHLGLKFDRPTSRASAEIIARNKREEIIRQDLIARGPQGAGVTALQFGAALAGAAIDPLNVAAAFIPFGSAARLAGVTARAAQTGARLTTTQRLTAGAIEGTLGNLAIEPIVYGLAREQQLDYTMSDALLNVALGGLLGGGLHAGVGKIGDFVQSRRPETRRVALETSVAQFSQGRTIDVEPVFKAANTTSRASDSFNPNAVFRDLDARVETRAQEILEGGLPDDLAILRSGGRATQRQGGERLTSFLRRAGGLREFEGELRNIGITPRTRPGLINNRAGMPLDDAALRAWEEGFFPERTERPTVSEFLDALDEDFRGTQPRVRETDFDAEAEAARLRQLEQELGRVGADLRGSDEEVARQIALSEFRERPLSELDPDARAIAEREVEQIARDASRSESLPERDATADFQASREAAAELRQRGEAEDELLQQVEELEAEAKRLEPDFEAETTIPVRLSDGSESRMTIEQYREAARAGALCLRR